jgi:hypothetical protein
MDDNKETSLDSNGDENENKNDDERKDEHEKPQGIERTAGDASDSELSRRNRKSN